jgi:phosphatidate cytidylyltransferase
MSSLPTRITSALIAIAVIGALFYFFQLNGLKTVIIFASLAGARELNRFIFPKGEPHDENFVNRVLFYIFNFLIFALSCWRPMFSGFIFAFFYVCFCVASIIRGRLNQNLADLSEAQAKAALGFFYVGLLPAFAFYLLNLPNGLWWFLSLLCIVFAGDIGAFAAGIAFGERKIMPHISPKKTVAGALGGLAFSLIAGLSCSFLFPEISKVAFCLLAIATGVIAQFGDYFESLLKRVANVKDSGGLMPGHGGVLDRIDGVLFACPIFVLGAILLENLL